MLPFWCQTFSCFRLASSSSSSPFPSCSTDTDSPYLDLRVARVVASLRTFAVHPEVKTLQSSSWMWSHAMPEISLQFQYNAVDMLSCSSNTTLGRSRGCLGIVNFVSISSYSTDIVTRGWYEIHLSYTYLNDDQWDTGTFSHWAYPPYSAIVLLLHALFPSVFMSLWSVMCLCWLFRPM